jgi:thiol-disulfide isomerase/thioredoxin
MVKTSVLAMCVVLLAGGLASSEVFEGLVLRDMEGNPVYVDSLLVAGPVVINFWATWCRPCLVEMPRLEEICGEMASKGIHCAAVSLDTRRMRSRLEEYIDRFEVSLPVYSDPEATLAKRFKVTAIPTTIVLDQNAEVYHRSRGYRPGDEILLKKKIESLVREPEEQEKEQPAPQ